MSKLKLPEITLVMIDTHCPQLAKLAVEDSMADIDYGGAIIFSDKDLGVENASWVKIAKLDSLGDYCNLVWYDLPGCLATPWALIIQWDSWVANAQCWDNEFLKYDYIGAPWWYDDGLNVGNGCGLRSLRLMNFLVDNKDEFPLLTPREDHVLCRIHRRALEEYGFRWAPDNVASRFSLETTRPSATSKHFMFHDSFNFPFVLEGKRLEERLQLMYATPYIRKSNKIDELKAGRRPLLLPQLAA